LNVVKKFHKQLSVCFNTLHPETATQNLKIQLRLPLVQGSFGLDYTTSHIATAAWLSMAARCDLAVAQGPAIFRSITGEGPKLQSLWLSLLAYASSICPPETPNPQNIAPDILPHVVNSPKATSGVCADSQYHHLYASL
jgi:hypothetical protein